MIDYLDLVLNNQYFHLVAVIAIVGAFFYAEYRFRQVLRRLDAILEGTAKSDKQLLRHPIGATNTTTEEPKLEGE